MLRPGDRIGNYAIQKLLGKGGMGHVYLAQHCTLGGLVAMKVLRPDVSENGTYVARFLREGKLAFKIRHPNLVAVHDAGCDGATGLYYLVMDYVSGGTLADLMRREGRLPAERALGIVRQVACALEAAADHGMVHRDVKPANIMFDGDGRVKLADLGIAKGGDEGTVMTQTNAVFGTPAYMSPEQARDAGKVDNRTDIYSLGVVLWQMLTGEQPYRNKMPLAIVAELLKGQSLPDIRTLAPDVQQEVATLVRDMCAPEVGKRIASPRILVKRLDAILAGSCAGDESAGDAPTCPTTFAKSATFSTAKHKGGHHLGMVFLGGLLVFVCVIAIVCLLPERRSLERAVPPGVVVTPPQSVQSPPERKSERTSVETDRNEVDRKAEQARKAEEARLAAEQARKAEEARLAAEQARKAEEARLAAEAARKAEEARLVATNRETNAERDAEEQREREAAVAKKAEEDRLAEEARRVAATLRTAPSPAGDDSEKPRPQTAVRPPARVGDDDSPAANAERALAAFTIGNWSLGYQYALRADPHNAQVRLWLGKCFDPSVEMPGFRHKKDVERARSHYRAAAKMGCTEAQRLLNGL